MSIQEIFDNGYTIIPSLISNKTCDKLKNILDKSFNEDLPFNFFKGHFQQLLPKNEDEIPYNILFNKKIHNIISQIFGKRKYYLYSYTCNSNLAKECQPYHMDCRHYYPLETIKQFGSQGLPLQLIVNTYLEDTNEDNASFEIIPGSHKITDFELGEDGEINDKYTNKLHKIKCNLPRGSIIIRDKRTWHRGTNNPSMKVRHMVGTSYSINWYNLNNKLKFNSDSEYMFYDAPFSTHNLLFT